MSDNADIDADAVDTLLSALSQQLLARDERYSIIVIGGSGLLVLGVIARTTRDIDVVALVRDGSIVSPNPLPEGLLAATRLVAADFGLSEDWLNTGPASLLDFGLPDGFLERATQRAYGQALETGTGGALRLTRGSDPLQALCRRRPRRRQASRRPSGARPQRS